MGDRRMSPLSPSIPPITPLKRAAHWGLTPPAAPGFPPGLGRSDKSKRTSPKAPLCVSAPGGFPRLPCVFPPTAVPKAPLCKGSCQRS